MISSLPCRKDKKASESYINYFHGNVLANERYIKMRTDYPLYLIAIICFIGALYAYVTLAQTPLYLYALAVLGIIFLGLGYIVKPKPAAPPSSSTTQPPIKSSLAASQPEPEEEPEKPSLKKQTRTRRKTTRKRRKKKE